MALSFHSKSFSCTRDSAFFSFFCDIGLLSGQQDCSDGGVQKLAAQRAHKLRQLLREPRILFALSFADNPKRTMICSSMLPGYRICTNRKTIRAMLSSSRSIEHILHSAFAVSSAGFCSPLKIKSSTSQKTGQERHHAVLCFVPRLQVASSAYPPAISVIR